MFKKLKKYIQDTEESLRLASMSCKTNEDTPQCALIEELRNLQHEKYDADNMNLESEMYQILKGIFGDMGYYRTNSYTVFGYSLGRAINGREYIPSIIVSRVIEELSKYRDYAVKYENKKQRRMELEKRIEEIKLELGIR
ncbi:hypothetical protein DS742_14490 [Lacrimispora amygdalina]|uniref:Uncharacterized protein n=1 Tax=Lacrimispora amygdalina TaxID=253257 RepID=A0A3E2NBC7_9FIRM|nr:hypothetical protein [Clostridium indicum]RFZ78318.1 hypothetical protein DS742_14490 [Clostridium indicum]